MWPDLPLGDTPGIRIPDEEVLVRRGDGEADATQFTQANGRRQRLTRLRKPQRARARAKASERERKRERERERERESTMANQASAKDSGNGRRVIVHGLLYILCARN